MSVMTQPTRFNEAGAVMPRKSRHQCIMRELDDVASMRPGLLCPGKGRCASASWRIRACFNEAGAVMPRKSRTA